jgi:hypothetical protein
MSLSRSIITKSSPVSVNSTSSTHIIFSSSRVSRKFIEKFGRQAFKDNYLPLFNIAGPHLPGKKFIWPEEAEAQEDLTHRESFRLLRGDGLAPET